jgi:hypothetical protein
MAITDGQVETGDEREQQPPEATTPREAWLEVAAVDVDGELARLATAARRGRPLPPRE